MYTTLATNKYKIRPKSWWKLQTDLEKQRYTILYDWFDNKIISKSRFLKHKILKLNWENLTQKKIVYDYSRQFEKKN